MYKTISKAEVAHSLYSLSLDDDRDYEIEAILTKAFSLGFHADNVLNVFGMVLGKRQSDTQYITPLCPRCRSKDTFMITVLPNNIEYQCTACSCQKQLGRTFVELINLYAETSRREIINKLKGLIKTRAPQPSLYELRKRMIKKYQDAHGVQKIDTKKEKSKK